MNAKPYPEYKESGVQWLGNVPEHWVVKGLRYICRFAYGDSLAAETREEGCVPVYGSNGKVGTHVHSNTKAPVIVVGRKGSFGKVNFSDEQVFAIDTTYFIDNSCTNERLSWLKYSLLPLRLDSASKDSAVPGLAREDAYESKLPVPPLPEQAAIADFLDRETGQIDALVARKRRLIELLREKRTAIISRTVTRGLHADAAREFGFEPHTRFRDSGIDWLGEVPEGWEIWKLSHGFQNTGSGTTPPSDNDAWYDGNIPWVTTSELRESIIYETSKNVSVDAIATFSALNLFPEGSLAIAMYGATIGRLGILGVPATTNQACCVMSGERALNARFMFLWFQAFREQVILLATGGGQPNISQEKIRSIRVACPSIFEQTAIATWLDRETSKIDRLVEKVEAAVDRLQEYRTALITSAVTGKIDVREVVA